MVEIKRFKQHMLRMIWPPWGDLKLPGLPTSLLPERRNDKLVCPGTFAVVSPGFGHLVPNKLRAIEWTKKGPSGYWGAFEEKTFFDL